MQSHNQRIRALLLILLVAVVAAIMLVTAYSYSRASGLLPRFAGWIFLGLASLEVLVQLKALIAARRGPPEIMQTTVAHGHQQWLQGLKGFLWLAFMLALIFFAGFLIATPVFVFAFLWTSARNSVTRAGIVAAVTTAFVYLVFAKLLDYKLYAGVLFQQ